VHAKVLVADSRYLKIGSANLNNRSMGYDTECDVLLDATHAADEEATRRGILNVRASLLAEHLGLSTREVAKAISDQQSLVAAIEALNGAGRLRRVEARPLKPEEEIIAETDLVDPERPKKRWGHFPNPFSALLQGIA
jgi:phospholipase D1/2